MSRVGSFQGPTFVVGIPLSVIHPIDNKFPGPYTDALMDPALALTPAQQQELQKQIDDLFGTLQEVRRNAPYYGF